MADAVREIAPGARLIAAVGVPGLVLEEAAADAEDPALDLLGPEHAAVARAVMKRRREFATVRACARRALARLGEPPAPILRGERGAPVWPDGIVGSMTHCEGYRAAAVARSRHVLSVGIDAEPAGPLPPGVLDLIARPEERARLAGLDAGRPGIPWDRLLFTAKEAVYKTWFPVARRRLDFHQAEVVLRAGPDGSAGTFTARLLTADPALPEALPGHWLHAAGPGLLLAAIALPAPPRSVPDLEPAGSPAP
nr:4'-phosphopantetheinyl transferase superfamily protein [Phaeacidiphilus oryzae]